MIEEDVQIDLPPDDVEVGLVVHVEEHADVVPLRDQLDVVAHRSQPRDRVAVAGERTGAVAHLEQEVGVDPRRPLHQSHHRVRLGDIARDQAEPLV